MLPSTKYQPKAGFTGRFPSLIRVYRSLLEIIQFLIPPEFVEILLPLGTNCFSA